MRYIRTKDGRIIEENNYNYIIKNNKLYEKEYFANPFGDGTEEYLGEVLIGEIIAKSDNLAELCDTYVFVGEDKDCYGHPLLWNIKQDIPFLMKYYYEQNIIYGAVWASKGLIYVAKMVDGKLVLI